MDPLSLAHIPQLAYPPTNYIGTTLFLGYILAALYLTFSISFSLYTQYQTLLSNSTTTTQDDKLKAVKMARAQHIKIYAFLATISFGTLSYHMLLFLVQSYLKWSGSKSVSLRELEAGKLWAWMLESQLFTEFAGELVRDGASAFWTQVGVVGMWFWNIWMGRKARKYHFSQQLMTRYILLGQILPTSFTASLFIIQLHLSAPELSQDSGISKEEEKKKEQASRQKVHKKTLSTFPTSCSTSVFLPPQLSANTICLSRLFY